MKKIFSNVKILSLLTLFIMSGFIISLAVPACASEKEAGMVISVKGKAWVYRAVKGRERKRRIFDMEMLKLNDKIVTASGATLTLSLFADNREYVLSENTEVVLKADAVEVGKGKLDKKGRASSLNMPKNLGHSSRKLMGGAALRGDFNSSGRGEKSYTGMIYPTDKSVILNGTLDFQWKFRKESRKTRFTLKNLTDNKTIVSLNVKGDKLPWPPTDQFSPLEPGKKYQVDIEPETTGTIMDLEMYTIVFEVLNEKDADKLKVMKRNELIRMMFIYIESRLYLEALDTAKKLEKMDPENPNIYFYQASIYELMGQEALAAKAEKKGSEIRAKFEKE